MITPVRSRVGFGIFLLNFRYTKSYEILHYVNIKIMLNLVSKIKINCFSIIIISMKNASFYYDF